MIISLKPAIGAWIVASALLTTVAGCQHHFGAAHAATYYVATTGNNSNPGTEDKPFRTIAYAVDTMVAGDTTYVRNGTYDETSVVRFRRPGSQPAPIQLLNYPGELPTINCTGTSRTKRLGILIQNQSGFRLAMGWITIDGFEIKNCWDGIKMYNTHDSTIRRNRIHDNLNQGILATGAARVLIDRNIINHNGPFLTHPNSNLEHGIYMNGTAITITNNLIYDNLAYGIQQNGSSSSAYDPAKHAATEFAGSHDWIIANNTIAYNVNRAGIVVWGSRCNNARIENNIFYENAVSLSNSFPQGIEFTSVGESGSPGIRIKNNYYYASGSGGMRAIRETHPSDLVFDKSNIVNEAPPEFVNAPATLPAWPAFHATSKSPFIDKGFKITEVKTDFEGTHRPQGCAYDIGAYEFPNPKPNCEKQRLSPPRVKIH